MRQQGGRTGWQRGGRQRAQVVRVAAGGGRGAQDCGGRLCMPLGDRAAVISHCAVRCVPRSACKLRQSGIAAELPRQQTDYVSNELLTSHLCTLLSSFSVAEHKICFKVNLKKHELCQPHTLAYHVCAKPKFTY